VSPERWKRAREIFQVALEQTPAEADAFLCAKCGSDADLVSEVRRMLEEHGRTGILDHAPWEQSPKPASPQVFSAGQLVGERYRIIRYIARGGMGEVYEAEDLQLKERVALKTLLPEIASDEGMVARFKQEIQLSRKIGHQNVCRVYDLAWHHVEASAPVFFLTMEFLSGETLSARLQREGPMSTPEALLLVQQMADALEAAHRAGVVHRDFKPSNVMLVPGGEGQRVVVTDFGLARRFSTGSGSTETMSSKVVGTLDYMAPELLLGAVASARSDIYALGMVVYKMVTGALPFGADTPLAAAFLRARKPVPSPRVLVPELDANWERGILRALDSDPGRRFANAGEFAKALSGEWAAGTTGVTIFSRKKLLAAACALLLPAILWIGWQNWPRNGNQPPPEAVRFYRLGVDDIHALAYFAATKALDQAVKLAPRFTLAHARLAEAWLELDLPEKAGREFLPARREDNSVLSKIDQFQIEAVDLTITREFAAAAAKYEQMVRLSGAEDLNVDLGRAYEKASKPDLAIESYRRAAEGSTHSPAAWLRLAVLYSQRSETTKSDAAFDQADQLYQLRSNLEGLTAVALQRGVAANRRGKRSEAEAFLNKAIERAHDTGNLHQEISAKLTMANNAYAAGDTDRAETLARAALATAQSNQMEELAIRGFVNLGLAYSNRGDLKGAEQHFRDALALARRTDSWRLAALSQLSLAGVHDQLHQSEDETREAKEALDYFEPNHWAQETFQGLSLLGRAQLHSAHYAEALDSFQRLLAGAEKAQDRSRIALAHENLGIVLTVEEDYPKALEHYQAFLNSSPDDMRKAYAARECADTLARLGQYHEAADAFKMAEEASAKNPPLRASIARHRTTMSLSQGLWRDAISGSKSALEDLGLSPLNSVDMTRVLGLALVRSGQLEAGLRKCGEALAAAQKLNDPGALIDTRMAILEAYVTAHDQARALSVFHDLEPVLDALPETRWLALSLMSRLDPQYEGRAREAMNKLSVLWGNGAFRQYLQRPDVHELSWRLLTTNSAKP